MHVQRNNEACLRNIVAVEKQEVLHISLCVCVDEWVGVGVVTRTRVCACARVALLIQHATRICHVFCGLSGSTIFLQHHLINGTILGKKSLKIKCVF